MSIPYNAAILLLDRVLGKNPVLVQRKCSIVGGGEKLCICKTEINKLWYIHITGYYTSIKIKEAELYTSTWINREAVILSKKSNR